MVSLQLVFVFVVSLGVQIEVPGLQTFQTCHFRVSFLDGTILGWP